MWTQVVVAKKFRITNHTVCTVMAAVDVAGIMAVELNPQKKGLKLSCAMRLR